MKKKLTRRKHSLADDIRESLREAGDYFAGKKTKVIVHLRHRKEAEARKLRRTVFKDLKP